MTDVAVTVWRFLGFEDDRTGERVPVDVTLRLDTDDERMVAMVEDAARCYGIDLERIAP